MEKFQPLLKYRNPKSYFSIEENYLHFQQSLLTFSETQGPLELRETQGPIAPETFTSLEVFIYRKKHTLIHQIKKNSVLSLVNENHNACQTLDTFRKGCTSNNAWYI